MRSPWMEVPFGTQVNGTSICPAIRRHVRTLHAARSGLLFRERVE